VVPGHRKALSHRIVDGGSSGYDLAVRLDQNLPGDISIESKVSQEKTLIAKPGEGGVQVALVGLRGWDGCADVGGARSPSSCACVL
jgi:hypothetical protein